MSELPAMLDLWQESLHWQPNQSQLALFERLYQAILEGNQKQNLTRITESREFWEKHLWDSLLGIMPFLRADLALPELTITDFWTQKPNQKLKIVDIGTGAGFPGMPIAIANSDWSLTMVDSTRKKVTFIENAIAQLNLNNAKALVSRAESLGRDQFHREQYDLALIRAVGQPNVCAEYVLPLVRVGGFAVLYRGLWAEADTQSLAVAAKQLGSKIAHISSTSTPLSLSTRNCIYLYKHSPLSDRYPRAIGIPKQQPLS